MQEKPKITLKELTDIYDIEDTPEDIKQEDSGEKPQSEFEIYTQTYDKKQIEEQDG